MRCWGFAGDGRLGYANTSDIGDTETPGSAGAVEISGPSAACPPAVVAILPPAVPRPRPRRPSIPTPPRARSTLARAPTRRSGAPRCRRACARRRARWADGGPLRDTTPEAARTFGASNASAGDLDLDGRNDSLVSSRGGGVGRVTIFGGPLLTTVPGPAGRAPAPAAAGSGDHGAAHRRRAVVVLRLRVAQAPDVPQPAGEGHDLPAGRGPDDGEPQDDARRAQRADREREQDSHDPRESAPDAPAVASERAAAAPRPGAAAHAPYQGCAPGDVHALGRQGAHAQQVAVDRGRPVAADGKAAAWEAPLP